MRRTRIAAVAVLVVLGVALVAGGAPAGAGGGTYLMPDRESYHPGDVVHLSAIVTKLDRDWYGPYTVKLQSFSGLVPGSDDGIPVGRLVVTRLDDTTVRAEVTFVLPKLPDGQWMTTYCSVDCAHALGDLSRGGLVLIGDPPPLPSFPPPTTTPTTVATTRRVTTTAAPPTTAAPAEQLLAAAPADDGAGSGDGAILTGFVLGVVVALVLVGLVALVERRRRPGPRRVITSSGAVASDPADPPVVPVGLERDADARPVGAGR